MCFSTLFIELMPTIALESTADGLRIYYKKSDGKTEDIVNLYWKRLLDILFLIKYLDDNTLIGVYHLKDGEGKILHSDKYEKKGDYFYITREDGALGVLIPNYTDYYTDCGELLFYYINSCFHASETLRELVKNNFEDEETKRFKINIRSTWIAIGVAYFGVLAQILISLTQSVTVNDKQFDEIRNKLKDISTILREQKHTPIDSLSEKDYILPK